jgi:hypothetical protein
MSTEAAAPRVLTAAETWSLVVIETATIVLHFLFGMMFCKEFLQGMLLSVTQRDMLVHVLSNVAILYWIVYRLSYDAIDMSTREIAFRFGLKRFAPGKVFAAVCLLHFAGFALISMLQQWQHGHTLFSLDNFYDFNGNIDWIRYAYHRLSSRIGVCSKSDVLPVILTQVDRHDSDVAAPRRGRLSRRYVYHYPQAVRYTQ